MLSRKFRLSKTSYLKTTKKISTIVFVLKISESDENKPRFTFIVSKKVHKNAVVRNKIKRNLAKAVSSILQNIKNYNFVIIAQKEILEKEASEIEKQIKEVFEKNNLIK